METKLTIWSQRGLTLLGKVIISKTFGMSNLIYSMSNTLSNDSDIRSAQKVINNFIWSNKPSKIQHLSLVADYSNAGIRSPDLITMKESLRLA